MDIKAYINNRRLEMVKESKKLADQKDKIVQQGQYLQSQLQQTNTALAKLDVELEVLDRLEAEEAKEEAPPC